MNRRENSIYKYFTPEGGGKAWRDIKRSLYMIEGIYRGFKQIGGLKWYTEDLNQLEDWRDIQRI